MSPVVKLPVGVGCDGRPTATPYVTTVDPCSMTRSSRDERLTSSLIGASAVVDSAPDHHTTPDPTGAANSSAPIHLRRFHSISAPILTTGCKGKERAVE